MGMTVYVCPITGAEMTSESFLGDNCEKVEDCPALVAVKTRMVAESDDAEVDVGCGNAFGGGDEEEAGDSSDGPKVPLVVKNFQYKPFPGQMDKKTLVGLLKGYIQGTMKAKKLKKKAKESDEGKAEFEKFKKESMEVMKFLSKKSVMEECDYYMNEKEDLEGCLGIAWWAGPGATATCPCFLYWLTAFNKTAY